MLLLLAALSAAADSPAPAKVEQQARARVTILRPHLASPKTWDPAANNTIESLYVDGTRVYVGGSFTMLGSVTRNRLAEVDAAAALQAAPTLRFSPARRGDTAVVAPIQVPIHFTLPDSLQDTGTD